MVSRVGEYGITIWVTVTACALYWCIESAPQHPDGPKFKKISHIHIEIIPLFHAPYFMPVANERRWKRLSQSKSRNQFIHFLYLLGDLRYGSKISCRIEISHICLDRLCQISPVRIRTASAEKDRNDSSDFLSNLLIKPDWHESGSSDSMLLTYRASKFSSGSSRDRSYALVWSRTCFVKARWQRPVWPRFLLC